MPSALVTVEKTMASEKWTNTHCVIWGPNGEDEPTDAALDALGCNIALTPANTASGAAATLLEAIVSFERLIHSTFATISRIYVTDGRRNRSGDTEYFVASASLAGLGAFAASGYNDLVPGSIALQVNRLPFGYSHRPGRLFLRGVLLDAEVNFSGPKLVGWYDATSQGNATARITSAVTNSHLNTYFGASTDPASPKYAIPHYLRTVPNPPPPPNNEGALINAFPVASFAVVGPTARQATRGRHRRRVSGTGV